jgi:hypothetical protein
MRFAVRAMPEMANDLVIQEFCRIRGNDFVVASNTAHSEHEHALSVLHRAWSLLCRSPPHSRLARDHLGYMTASGTINNVSFFSVSKICIAL